ncbi:uncharacterized protein [Hoplias malabaricus]|uniref:uncharacterized protein isoform X2 n=1 Tax=Hoplias malabaricus TaxID=27720 RepID=UPI0034628B2E
MRVCVISLGGHKNIAADYMDLLCNVFRNTWDLKTWAVQYPPQWLQKDGQYCSVFVCTMAEIEVKGKWKAMQTDERQSTTELSSHLVKWISCLRFSFQRSQLKSWKNRGLQSFLGSDVVILPLFSCLSLTPETQHQTSGVTYAYCMRFVQPQSSSIHSPAAALQLSLTHAREMTPNLRGYLRLLHEVCSVSVLLYSQGSTVAQQVVSQSHSFRDLAVVGLIPAPCDCL